MRVYNIDELGKVYINDELITEVNRQRDTSWLNVTEHIVPGQENTLRFTVWNVAEEYTWGFALKGDDTVVWQDVQGQVGFKGANNNDLSKPNQTVYDKILLVDSVGQLSELSGSSYKWYVRLSDIDDMGTAFLNGNKLIDVFLDKGGDSGWVDITEWVLDNHENMLRFTSRNTGGKGIWNITLRRDGKTIWRDEGSTEKGGLVYDRIIYITHQGEVSAVPERTRWYVRIRIADDLSCVYVNGKPFLEMKFGDQERGWVEITRDVKPGQENVLCFSDWNGDRGPGQWDFALMRNDGIIWERTGQDEAGNQMVYDYLVFILPDEEVAGESPNPRWFVRVYDNDDRGAVFVNGEKIFEERTETGDWIDITDQILAGQENKIRFTNWNDRGPAVWRFALRRNNNIVWEDEGRIGEGKENQIVYDKTLTLTPAGELVAP